MKPTLVNEGVDANIGRLAVKGEQTLRSLTAWLGMTLGMAGYSVGQARAEVETETQTALNNAVAPPNPRPENKVEEGSTISSPSEPSYIAGEAVPSVIPGQITIAISTNRAAQLIPTNPNHGAREQIEWKVIRTYRLSQFQYDEGTRIFSASITDLYTPGEVRYISEHLRKLTQSSSDTVFRFNPVGVQHVKIELSAMGKQYPVDSLGDEEGVADIANGEVVVAYKVEDQQLHDLFREHPEAISLVITSRSRYETLQRNAIMIENILTTIRDSYEKVLPHGISISQLENGLITDRDSAVKLKQDLIHTVRGSIEGDPERLSIFKDMFNRISSMVEITPIPVWKLSDEMLQELVIWDRSTQSRDIQPSEKEAIINEREEATQTYESCRHAWDTMRKMAKEEGDHHAWNKKLSDAMKLDASLEGGVPLVFSMEGKMSLEKQHNESDEGFDQRVRKAYEEMRDAGELSQEKFHSMYLKHKGEEWAKSSAAKILKITQVTVLDSDSIKNTVFERIDRLSKSYRDRVARLPLRIDDNLPSEDLFEIDKLREENERLHQILNERNERYSRLFIAERRSLRISDDIDKVQEIIQNISARREFKNETLVQVGKLQAALDVYIEVTVIERGYAMADKAGDTKWLGGSDSPGKTRREDWEECKLAKEFARKAVEATFTDLEGLIKAEPNVDPALKTHISLMGFNLAAESIIAKYLGGMIPLGDLR